MTGNDPETHAALTGGLVRRYEEQRDWYGSRIYLMPELHHALHTCYQTLAMRIELTGGNIRESDTLLMAGSALANLETDIPPGELERQARLWHAAPVLAETLADTVDALEGAMYHIYHLNPTLRLDSTIVSEARAVLASIQKEEDK